MTPALRTAPHVLTPALVVALYVGVSCIKPFALAVGSGPMQFWLLDAVFFVLIPGVLFWLSTPMARGLGFVGAASAPNVRAADPADVWMIQIVAYMGLLLLLRAAFHAAFYREAWRLWLESAQLAWPWPQIHYAAQMGSGAARLLLAVYAAVVGAWVEEWVFRVLLLRVALARGWSALAYVAVSSSCFAAAHVGPGIATIVFAWLAGVVMAALFWRWRLFGPAVAAHALFNWVGWLFLY
jgi:membrane protease YdiL (CAAX protease family)